MEDEEKMIVEHLQQIATLRTHTEEHRRRISDLEVKVLDHSDKITTNDTKMGFIQAIGVATLSVVSGVLIILVIAAIKIIK